MNFSEFKKRLGAEPLSNDPELVEARAAGPEFERAAADAEAFERKLEAALNFAVDQDALVREVTEIPQRGMPRAYRWMAMAASILVAVGVGTLAVYRANQPADLNEYVAEHYQHDGARVLARASEDFDRAEVNRLMARFDAQVGPELVGKVNFVKLCPTLHGEGAHMIVSSDRGNVTVIYMPDTEVTETRLVVFDEMQAQVIALEAGSAAIIGKAGDTDPTLAALLRTSITPLSAGAES